MHIYMYMYTYMYEYSTSFTMKFFNVGRKAGRTAAAAGHVYIESQTKIGGGWAWDGMSTHSHFVHR